MLTILGKKLGMTQVFTESGEMVPVTVVEAGPATVTQVKTVENDGYNAVQIGFENLKENRANKPTKGHFDKWNAPLKKHLAEIRLEEGESYENGQIITVEYFEEGSLLDVTGTSKGKGTQGNIKRHGHGRGPMTHGSKHKRLPGALAGASYPGRVFKGNAGPGRMGRDTITVQNVELIKVIPERHVMLIKGALPGRKGALLTIQYAVKDSAAIEKSLKAKDFKPQFTETADDAEKKNKKKAKDDSKKAETVTETVKEDAPVTSPEESADAVREDVSTEVSVPANEVQANEAPASEAEKTVSEDIEVASEDTEKETAQPSAPEKSEEKAEEKAEDKE